MEKWIVIEDHPNYEVSNEGRLGIGGLEGY